MRRTMGLSFALGALALMALVSCVKATPTATPVPTPTATAILAPTATPTPTATALPGPTATPTATSVPTPTSTPSSIPTPTPTPTPTSVPTWSFQPAACEFEVPVGEVVECGYLTVPEDHSRPDGDTIRLHVAVVRSHSPYPELDPIVYLAGGPGEKALATIPLVFFDQFSPFIENREIIIFDQRGVGFSQPALDCPEATGLFYELLDKDLSVAEEDSLVVEAASSCHQRLLDEGVNLEAFTTVQSAADVAVLREALGYDEWNLYGVSYGTP